MVHVSKAAFRLVRAPKEAIARRVFLDDVTSAYQGTTSPLVILGAPGTGKTSLLIEAALSRINAGQNPNSILLITFDRERASQLRDAIALQTTATMFEPLARTFHSLAFSILKKKKSLQDLDPILLSGPEQEKFIRDLLENDTQIQWPDELKAALTTRGFVRELRDLMLRANERGLSFQELADLGKERGEKFWPAASHFWERYTKASIMRELGAGDSKERLDPTEIVTVASQRLQNNPELLGELRAQFTTLMVDEFQESDPAQRKLLKLIAGSDLLIAGDPNSAVGRFRGADPDGLMAELDSYNAREIILKTSFRSSPSLARLSEDFARKKFSNTKTIDRKPDEKREIRRDSVEIHRFRSASEEAAFIAHQFRSAHLRGGIPYSDMAVIVRNHGAITGALRRAFVHLGIPVSNELTALARNSAIAPFLLLAQVGVGKKLDLAVCEKLLLSEFGGADSIALRRIRRALIATRPEGDLRTGSELMISAIDEGEIFIEGAQSFRRVHDLLSKARKAVHRANARAEDLLWAIWDNALDYEGVKLSTAWREQSLRQSVRASVADRNLDAMMALFDSAARYSERFPHSTPAAFIEEIATAEIAGDVITAKGARSGYIEILTVHATKGREWEIVAIAGVQEGVWPNLKARSSLLGAERLVEMVRHSDIPSAQLRVIAVNGLQRDEERLFHVAISRAKSTLFITAVSKEDDEPSEFFDFARRAVTGFDEPFTEVPRPITPAALVADLRSQLSGESATEAASILKRLADEGIALASPANWVGWIPRSTDQPIYRAEELVPLSPSGLESFEECALKWFLQSNGGTDGDSAAQLLGSAIHAFAARMVEVPGTTEEELAQALRSSWKLIDPNSGWISASAYERAATILTRFIRYHSATNRKVLAVEKSFKVEVGRALIRGNIDRIEVEADGSLFIIDFKTGQEVVSPKEIDQNLQLAAYQLGVIKGGLAQISSSQITSGAELVYLAKETVKVSRRTQSVINPDNFIDRISAIAQGMGAHSFVATINARCKKCPVRTSCPLQSDGRTVIQ